MPRRATPGSTRLRAEGLEESVEEAFLVGSVGRSGRGRVSSLGWAGVCDISGSGAWALPHVVRYLAAGSQGRRRAVGGESPTQAGTGCVNVALFGLHVEDMLTEDLSAVSGNWPVLERTISEARDARASRARETYTCTYIVHTPVRATARRAEKTAGLFKTVLVHSSATRRLLTGVTRLTTCESVSRSKTQMTRTLSKQNNCIPETGYAGGEWPEQTDDSEAT